MGPKSNISLFNANLLNSNVKRGKKAALYGMYGKRWRKMVGHKEAGQERDERETEKIITYLIPITFLEKFYFLFHFAGAIM